MITLLSYPLFYYAYKFGVPDTQGLKDYQSYYHLYLNWDFDKVASPFNTRVISTYGVYLLSKLGYAYETEINFNVSGKDKVVFFNALLVNYLSLVLTCFMIYKIIYREFKNKMYAFAIGIGYLLSFGTLFFAINPLTDSLPGLFIAIAFYFYLKEKYWIIIPLALSIFQREYVFFIFGLLTFVKILNDRSLKNNSYYIAVLSINIICFFTYFYLRKTIFFTDQHQGQLDVGSYLYKLTHPNFPILAYVKQSFLNQNILILYFLLIAYKTFRSEKIDGFYLVNTILLYLQVHFVSFVAVLGNSTGRYFYLTTPIITYYIARELYPIVKKEFQLSLN